MYPVAALLRAGGLLAVWIVIGGPGLAGLAVGIVTAGLGSWASLRLLPPGHLRIHPGALAMLLLRFPWQALRAGIDVARRAFDPRLPVQPGFVLHRPRIEAGLMRDAFLTWSGMQPGTLPVGPAPAGAVLVHALDTEQPVAEAMAREEARFARAAGG